VPPQLPGITAANRIIVLAEDLLKTHKLTRDQAIQIACAATIAYSMPSD